MAAILLPCEQELRIFYPYHPHPEESKKGLLETHVKFHPFENFSIATVDKSDDNYSFSLGSMKAFWAYPSSHQFY